MNDILLVSSVSDFGQTDLPTLLSSGSDLNSLGAISSNEFDLPSVPASLDVQFDIQYEENIRKYICFKTSSSRPS